jgi:hypothetical protein
MSILDELATPQGQNGGEANRQVAVKCAEVPKRLDEIAQGLGGRNLKIVGDCCEVFTETAKLDPALVAPYQAALWAMTGHKNGRVQWESMHAIALTAGVAPHFVGERLDDLMRVIENAPGVIVRGYAIEAIGCYGGSGPDAARRALPNLKRAAELWEGRHAGAVLNALSAILPSAPEIRQDAIDLASIHLDAPGSLGKSARKLMKLVGKNGAR